MPKPEQLSATTYLKEVNMLEKTFGITVAAWAAIAVAVVAVGAAAYGAVAQAEAAHKAQQAQEAAARQAEANAKKQEQDSMLQQNFLSKETTKIKPADFQPGGVAVSSGEARGGGGF